MTKTHPNRKQSNLKRYLFATILPIIFLCLSLSVLLYDQVQLYKFTRAEIHGVQMIRFLYGSLTDLQKIRGYSQISQWGRHEEINEHLKQLKQQFLNRFANREWLRETNSFHLQEESAHISAAAKLLFQIKPSEAAERKTFNRYSALITDILKLMQLTADQANLILDPELDTNYLIDVLDKQIPYLAESVGRVRGLGSGFLAKKQITIDEREQLHNFQAAILTRIESIRDAQDVIIKTSSNLKNNFHLLPDKLDQVIDPLVNKCLLLEDSADCPDVSPEEFFQLATQVIDLLSTPYQTGIILLTSKLKARQTQHLLQGSFIFFGTAIAIALMLYFNRAFFLYDQKLHSEMEKLSITDQLTGLYNRRHFYNVFPRELRNSLRHGGQLYLGLLDVDNFKLYNDRYGHPAGDQALKAISTTMNEILQRAGDYCFRIGGEEFCFLFNETDVEKAKDFADRIRQKIEALGIIHEKNRPYNVVTISFGLIRIPEDLDCILEQMMTKVDKALYMAKKAGRNQYIYLD